MFEHRTIPGLAEDRRLVFYKSVPTLQDFASSTVALSIWFNYVEWSRTRNVIVAFNDNLAAALGIDSNYPEEIAQFVERLQTPKRIEAMIKASVYQVGQNMTECISYYDDAFGLPVTLYGIEYFDINWFVWYRNGQIDYRKTASRVLLSEEREISDEAEEPEERKFLIMCKYCMEEEIRTIPLTASLLESRSFRFANFEHNFLTYYWVCFLKNELHQIPLGNFTSINVVMAKRCTYEERYAFQYFWNRLGDADRLLVIGDGFESRFQCGVISTMSVEQQGLMFYRMPPGESVVNFFNHLDILGVAFSTWMLVKDRITMEQFSHLVVTLFSRWIFCDERMNLLVKVWETASDRLKGHVVRNSADSIIEALVQGRTYKDENFYENDVPSSAVQRVRGQLRIRYESSVLVKPLLKEISKSAMNFLYKFFSSMSVDSRIDEFLSHAEIFAAHIVDPASISQLIDLCLPTEEDRLEFKDEVTSSPYVLEHCAVLILEDQFEILNAKLEYFWTSAEAARAYIIDLLQSERICHFRLPIDSKKWSGLSGFIDETCQNDVLASQIKNIILSRSISESTACVVWLCDEYLDEIIKVANHTSKALNTYKKTILKTIRFSVEDSFLETTSAFKIKRVLSWCFRNEHGVEIVQCATLLDDVFENSFADILSHPLRIKNDVPQDLVKLGKYMSLRFSTVEELKTFKIRLIYESDPGAVRRFLEQCGGDSFEKVLNWCFDNDQDAVRKFRCEKHDLFVQVNVLVNTDATRNSE